MLPDGRRLHLQDGPIDLVIGAEGRAARCGEVIGTVLHEQVIVLDANRPVRGEGVFEADADNGAPARFARIVEHEAGVGDYAVVLVAGHRGPRGRA